MFTPPSAQTWKGTDRVLGELEHYEAGDQLAAAGWATICVLGALRDRFERTPEDQQAFDLLCSETQSWLRREIGTLRFHKSQ